MFDFLFKYPFAAFHKGQLVLLGAWPGWLLAVLIVVAGAGVALFLRTTMARAAPVLRGWRLGVIGLLEWLTAAVILILLWQPALRVTELEPRQNIVAILVDDSRSMQQVENGATREAQAIRALQSGVLPSLQRSFQTRLYRFDTSLTRIAGLSELGPAAAPATHIGTSLEQLVTQTGDLPLGAVVLLSDGGDNAGGVDRHVIDALRNRRVPVYTVGFGAEQVAQDVEIEDVVVASRVLAGSRLSATVKFQQRGYDRQKSTLAVRVGGRVLGSREVTFAPDGSVQAENMLFNIGPAGAKTLQFTVEPLDSEANRANNTLTRLVNVDPDPRRILYFSKASRAGSTSSSGARLKMIR